MTRAQQLTGGALLLAAATLGIGLTTATDAAAASCSAITISAGRNLTFDVSSVTVQRGGCVRFANLTDVTVTVTVSGSSFSEKLPARTPASASASYTARRSATATASDGVRTGQGRIEVESSGSAPPPAATPTRSTVAGPPVQSPTPVATSATPAAAGGSHGPSSTVTTAAPAAVNVQHPLADPAVPVLPAFPPPAGTSGTDAPTVSHPVVAPRVKVGSDPRLTSTVLEPAGATGRGLPATVAAVLLVGLATAYGRTVLVAGEAVDRRAPHRPVRPTV